MSPEYSDQIKKKISELISHYPEKKAALLPLLHITQQEFGQIGSSEEKMVADLLGITQIEVREVVTFYSMFIRKKIGKYHIQICSNLTCSLLGAESLLHFLQEKLGIKPGETTEDELFSLSTVECLGACEEAPVMMVNFDYHTQLDKGKIEKILGGLK